MKCVGVSFVTFFSFCLVVMSDWKWGWDFVDDCCGGKLN